MSKTANKRRGLLRLVFLGFMAIALMSGCRLANGTDGAGAVSQLGSFVESFALNVLAAWLV